MARSKSKTYSLELELCFDSANPSSVLEHASHSATSIYNAALGECLKRYRKLCYDRRYQDLQKEYKEARKQKAHLKEFHERFKALFLEYGYSEYSLQKYTESLLPEEKAVCTSSEPRDFSRRE